MAIPLHAAHGIHTVGPFFKGPQDMENIDLPGAGYPDDLDVDGIRKSHGTCQVRRGVPSEITAKGDDDRLECVGHFLTSGFYG
jgi:hypothetical protein